MVTSSAKWGMTPLHIATLLGKVEMVENFVEAGADPAARNAFDLSVVETAGIIAGAYQHSKPQYRTILNYLQQRRMSQLSHALGAYWRTPGRTPNSPSI
jgi:hypothetical protein